MWAERSMSARSFICDVLQCKVTKASSVTAQWAGGASARYTSALPSQGSDERMRNGSDERMRKMRKRSRAPAELRPLHPLSPVSQRHGASEVAKHQPWGCQAGAALFMMLCCKLTTIAHTTSSLRKDTAAKNTQPRMYPTRFCCPS